MPVNPCVGCSHKSCILDADHCERLYIYRGKVATAKLVLEYLLNQASAMNLTSETIINVVYVSKMLAMRKELEK
jgi:hypothetical protein